MTPGTFSGGTDAKVQDDHLEVSADGQGGWSWFKQALTHELTADDDGKYFRAYSLVTEGEMLASGASAAIGPVTTPVSFDKLIVSDPVVTGEPIVGYTLSCSAPTITGGSGEAQVAYYWQDANNSRVLYMGSTQQVKAVDIGRDIQCQVVVTDAAANEQVVVVSNSVGPIGRPVIPEYDVWVNGELHEDPSADVGVAPGGSVVLEVRPQPSTNAPADVVYNWQVRTGTGRLSGDLDGTGVIYLAPEEPPAGALVTCTVTSADADDSAYAAEVTILVSE